MAKTRSGSATVVERVISVYICNILMKINHWCYVDQSASNFSKISSFLWKCHCL